MNKSYWMFCFLFVFTMHASAGENATKAEQEPVKEQRKLKNIPQLPPEVNEKMYAEGVLKTESLSRDEYVDTYERTKDTALVIDGLGAGQYTISTTSEDIDPRPGSKIKVIDVGLGVDTDLVFVDSMGEPWPVRLAKVANPAYSVSTIAEHIVRIEVKKTFVTSSVNILLYGQTQPLILRLKHQVNLKGNVDGVKTYRISGLSPMSEKKPIGVGGEPIPDLRLDLNPFLDDLAPDDAIPVQVNGPSDVKVWTYKQKLVVRTKKTLVTPVGLPLYGVNGWKVYEIENPMPVIVLLEDGQQHYAYIPEDSISDMMRDRDNAE
ncbi:DotH/IcmK family type IV secretion protein [Aeromonas veronii]